jgi:hypothetical protein
LIIVPIATPPLWIVSVSPTFKTMPALLVMPPDGRTVLVMVFSRRYPY